MEQDRKVLTALHYECKDHNSAEEVLKLIEVGGKDILMKRDCLGQTAMQKNLFTIIIQIYSTIALYKW